MSRVCEVTGKRVIAGNNVSHANNRTKRRFLPNLQAVSFPSSVLGRCISLGKVSAAGIRHIEKAGGIDAFLLNSNASKLSLDMKKLQKMLFKTASKNS